MEHRKRVRATATVMLFWGVLLVSALGASEGSALHSLATLPMAPVERGEYMARDARSGSELWRTQ